MNTDWKDGFRRLFVRKNGLQWLDSTSNPPHVEAFIETLLTTQRAELAGKVEVMKSEQVSNSVDEFYLSTSIYNRVLALLTDKQ